MLWVFFRPSSLRCVFKNVLLELLKRSYVSRFLLTSFMTRGKKRSRKSERRSLNFANETSCIYFQNNIENK